MSSYNPEKSDTFEETLTWLMFIMLMGLIVFGLTRVDDTDPQEQCPCHTTYVSKGYYKCKCE